MDTSSSDALPESTGLVIVGAGIAGLGAASILEQSNFKDYILLEAQSQVGGRISSIPWNTGWLEKGAQFIHGTESALAKLIQENNLLSDAEVLESQGLYLREDGSRVDCKLISEVDAQIKSELRECEKYANDCEYDWTVIEDSIGKRLRTKFQKYLKTKNDPVHIKNIKEELFDWHVRFLAIDNACMRLDDLSVKSWGKYEEVGGPDCSIFKSHYSSIVELIAGELTQENIRLNCPVKRIEWNDELNSKDAKSIVLTLQDNRRIFASCAIVTCSLGYLKDNHEKLFSPPLPGRMTDAIQHLGFGVINKVFLDFDEPWWQPDTRSFQFLWRVDEEDNSQPARNELAAWARDLTGFEVLPGQRALLLGWVGGRGARLVETLAEEQIARDCALLFQHFLKSDNVPEARKCSRTCWSSNPYVRGAYSHIATRCDYAKVSPASLAEPVWAKITSNPKNEVNENEIWRKITTSDEKNDSLRLPVLMLAGEATHENYYSTTHGAYDSGVKQAQIFLRNYVTK